MRVNCKHRPRTHERYERTLRSYFPFGDTLPPRPSMMLGMVNCPTFFDPRKRKCVCLIGSQVDLNASAGTTWTMIDDEEGEQHAAAAEIRPMLSIKQCSP
jgi:hypothetical protein